MLDRFTVTTLLIYHEGYATHNETRNTVYLRTINHEKVNKYALCTGMVKYI